MALTQIPSFYSPGAYFYVDHTRAMSGNVELPNAVLYIGCRLSTGTVAQNVPRRLTRRSQADEEFGAGSMVATMANTGWDATDSGAIIEQWAIGIDAAGTAATGDITISGASTIAGTLRWEVGGRKLFVSIPNGTAAAAVPALMIAADHSTAPATAADGGSGAYDVTARHAIEEGNNIDLRVTEIPAGLTYVITPMAGGATNPSIAAALAAIAALRPQRIVLGFSDAANIDLLVADLTTRDSWANEAFCRGFVSSIADPATVNALASGYNSQYLSLTAYNYAASTPWEVSAWMAMVNARRAGNDPSANRNGLTGTLNILSGPRLEDRTEFSEWESMLAAGVAVMRMDDFGHPFIHRHVTTYTVNGDGVIDQTYRDASVVTTVWALRYTLDVFISARWKDAKLDDDGGEEPPPGSKLMTPAKLKAEYALAWELLWVPKLWVQLSKFDEFLSSMLSGINTDDVTRIDGAMFPRVISPLNQVATEIAFRR